MINIFKDALLTTRKFYSLMEMVKLDFIDWLLDLEEYFNFWKICYEEKVWLVFNKLDSEAEEWWEDIQIDRK